MTALFARLGVDYLQWKAVSGTLLRADFRAPLPQSGESYSMRSVRGFLVMALTFGVFGFSTVPIIVINPDVLLTGTIALAFLALVLSTALLTQHGATMLSPGDFLILGPRPVSSRTLFAIRLTNVLFHTALVTALTAYPSILAFTIAHGLSVARGAGAAVAIFAWGITVSLAVVAAYGTLLRVVGAERLQRAIGYTQLVIGIAAYGGVFLSLRSLGPRVLASLSMPDAGWVMLVPPAWFASYIEIAAGVADTASWWRAANALVALAAVIMLLQRTLAVGYAEQVSGIAATPAIARPQRTRRPRIFVRDEGRAVALLVAAHFRNDLRIRMGVLGVVPLVLVYLVAGIGDPNPDPFLPESRQPGVDLLAMSALMFPAILMQQLGSSEAHQASWIYRVAPTDAARLVLSLKNVAAVWFLLPFLALAAAVFWWRFGDAVHALAHTTIVGLLSHLALQGAMLVSPRLPFARPPDKALSGAGMFAWMFTVLVGGQLLYVAIRALVYPSWARVAACIAALAAASVVLERVLARRRTSLPLE